MNAPSVDIADILAAAGLGLTFATNLFVGEEPDSPNSCVTIFDTPGSPAQLTMTQGEDYYYPVVQVRVRGATFQTGYALMDGVRAALHGLNHKAWNGTNYQMIKCIQEPSLLDYDERQRPRWVATFEIQRN